LIINIAITAIKIAAGRNLEAETIKSHVKGASAIEKQK
jgi:hypothetical protein